eukprot:scaffold2015_cov125-Skeletonema_dohrnii-CCMP3373.AAC.1
MKSGIVESSSRPSRWDALRNDKDTQSSVSGSSRLSNSTGRRRRLNAPLNHMNGSTSSFSNNNNQSSASWRRRQQTNNSSSSNSRTPRSAEDDAIRKAIDNLRAAINNENDNSNAESIAELNIALFGSSDPIFFMSLLQTNETNPKMPLAKVSNDMKWEAAYSLLQLLSSQSTAIQKTIHIQSILCIARIASACLHLLSSQYNGGCPSSMSDVRLSECITILLDVLQLEDNGSTTMNGCNDLLCKSNLFQGIAKLLELSIIHGKTSKNTKDGRGPLCSWGAEKAVALIIKDSVLPFLEGLMSSTDDALSGSMKSTHSHGAVECIYLLLLGTNDRDPTSATKAQPKAFQASKHAASMLAALVVDVMPDGRETQRINPLRLRILRAVNACWRWSCENVHHSMKDPNIQGAQLEMSLRCMTVTLITMHALERGKVQSRQSRGGTSEMDVSAIARDIKNLLDVQELNSFQPQLLRLLTSLCLAYPVSTANQWHLFLDKTCSAQPFLLSTVEEGTLALRRKDFDTASWILLPDAVQTVSALISSIPFTNWIGGDGRPSTRMNGGNFACRVRNAMTTLMTSLTNLVTVVKDNISEGGSYSDESHFELIMMQSSLVAGKLCILLPFNDNNNAFLAPAMKVVQCAGDIFVLSARALESKRGDHNLLSSSM